jgi:outer membrane murein-binding lipoprotein Lpp
MKQLLFAIGMALILAATLIVQAGIATGHSRAKIGRLTDRVKTLEVTVSELQTTVANHEARIACLEEPGNGC